jgi:hypothetical protein
MRCVTSSDSATRDSSEPITSPLPSASRNAASSFQWEREWNNQVSSLSAGRARGSLLSTCPAAARDALEAMERMASTGFNYGRLIRRGVLWYPSGTSPPEARPVLPRRWPHVDRRRRRRRPLASRTAIAGPVRSPAISGRRHPDDRFPAEPTSATTCQPPPSRMPSSRSRCGAGSA